MNLPHAESARVDEDKVTRYLLAFDHPEGSSKAAFFSSFGFAAGDWRSLARALAGQARANSVTSMRESPYGTKYCIDGTIQCPDGRAPSIRTVWIIDAGEEYPRLVTAHPL